MRVMGIDPGSLRTGYGVVERQGGKYHYVAAGVIRPKDADPLPARLHFIYTELVQLFAEHEVKEAALESGNLPKSAQSAFVYGQARGVALAAVHQAGGRAFEYTTVQVKQAAAGTSKVGKDQIQRLVKAMLGLQQRTEMRLDASDALACAICHLDAYRYEVPKASLVLPTLTRSR